MPKSDKKQLSVQDPAGGVIQASQSFHDGPLPSPDDFRAYAEMLPSFPERYMAMVEKHQNYSIEAHRTETDRNHKRKLLGQYLAFGIFLFICGVAGAAFKYGFPWFSLGMAIVAVVCIAAVTRHDFNKARNAPQEKSGG